MNRTFSVLLIATLVLVLVAGVSMFWKPTAKNTKIREQGFSRTLPGKWIQKPSTDPSRWVYQNEQRKQLTVSLLTSTHELSKFSFK